MIELEKVYAFIEINFDYLLAVDDEETVVHASRPLKSSVGMKELEGVSLEDGLTPSSLRSFRTAMEKARKGSGEIVVLSHRDWDANPIPLKTGYAKTTEGGIYLFFGTRIESISKFSDSEKDERVKELSCIYSVAEWIEVSRSINEFFTKFSEYLAPGMQYPDSTSVYSEYRGVGYGTPPETDRKLQTTVVVNGKPAGSIAVFYDDPELELLPEEQKMLNEIARMLSLALERKELSQRLLLKQEEEAEYRRRFEKLQREIEQRTKELADQQKKLKTINSYIERSYRDWEMSKLRFETMFQAIPDDVVLIDRDRNVIMTNKEDVDPGRKCYSTFFDREEPCPDCRLDLILKNKTPVTLTLKNGDRYLQVHALPVFNEEHEVDGIMEFYRDITLEKTYEQQIQQADKLASLGELVSGIGHEINNPNQFIRGNIKILHQALDDILPILDEYYQDHPDLTIARLKYDFFREHVSTLLDDMRHGSERIKSIVEGLRRFARRDEGLLIDKIDINTLIESSARLVEKEVHKHAEIELDLAEDVPEFTGNSQKIEQVLVNLIVNASQAMPEGRRGLITVRTRVEGEQIHIQVEDDAKGMNEKVQKQIFDPFFTTRRAKGGTGLGLAIAYRIVEEHGGAISVSSTVGEGTTFTIRIPINREQDAVQSEPEEAGEEE
ncbi:hypothetical protein GF402_11435 [Candidatus Fermentibacteria bacterium]|nr:hypothetical protein [Candidatus Fermentibacteria bacterium]